MVLYQTRAPRRASPNQKKKKRLLGLALCLDVFYTFFFSLEKHTKNTSKPLDSSFFTKNTKYCSYTQSSSHWFYTLDLGFKVVDVAF